MTKRSGYSLKISAFIEASPTNMDEMRLAISAIDAACEALRKDGFQMVTHETRFMLSKDIPDEPKAAQAVPHEHVWYKLPDGRNACKCGVRELTPITDQLPIPPNLDRRKA